MPRFAAPVIGALAVGLIAVGAVTPASAAKPPPKPVESTPKNVIYIIVDGFGAAQVELGRRMNGGTLNLTDTVPWTTRATIDSSSLEGVTDSAAGATALASGVETLNGWVGTVPTAAGGVAPVETVLERAEDAGKATGLISDSYITDATPAAFAAHVSDRGENSEIAGQMAAQAIEFIFGGGLRQGSVDPLLNDPDVTYVTNTSGMQSYADSGQDGPVYGLFGSWNMSYNLDRDDEGVTAKEPTLPQMTTAALKVLDDDPNGFFLMVEAGLVDWAGHARDGASLGSEMIEADAAITTAYNWAKTRSDTLVVVTGDHETGGLKLSSRTDIAALRGQTATTEFMWGKISAGADIATTVKRYTGVTLSKSEVSTVSACGEHGISDVLAARWKLTWNNTCSGEGDHTGVPVPLYAWGPKSKDFAGTFYDNERVGQNLLSYMN